MQDALGLIEVTGLALAVTVADVMAKTASVRLLGIERTIGSGWILVKLDGDVAAVRTALAAGQQTAKAEKGFISCTTIARPATGTSEMVTASLRQPVVARQRHDGPVEKAAAKTATATGNDKPAQDLAPVIESIPAQTAAAELASETAPVPTPAAEELAAETAPVPTPAAEELVAETAPASTPAAEELVAETAPALTPAAGKPAPKRRRTRIK